MSEAAIALPGATAHPTRVSRRQWLVIALALLCALLAMGLQLHRSAVPAPPAANGRWQLDGARLSQARTWLPTVREAILLDAARRGTLALTIEGQRYLSVLGGRTHRTACTITSRADGLTALTLDQPDPLLGATLVFQADHGQVVLRVGGDDPLLLPLLRQAD